MVEAIQSAHETFHDFEEELSDENTVENEIRLDKTWTPMIET